MVWPIAEQLAEPPPVAARVEKKALWGSISGREFLAGLADGGGVAGERERERSERKEGKKKCELFFFPVFSRNGKKNQKIKKCSLTRPGPAPRGAPSARGKTASRWTRTATRGARSARAGTCTRLSAASGRGRPAATAARRPEGEAPRASGASGPRGRTTCPC